MFHFLLAVVFGSMVTVYDKGPPPIVGMGSSQPEAQQHIDTLKLRQQHDFKWYRNRWKWNLPLSVVAINRIEQSEYSKSDSDCFPEHDLYPHCHFEWMPKSWRYHAAVCRNQSYKRCRSEPRFLRRPECSARRKRRRCIGKSYLRLPMDTGSRPG